MCQLLLPVIGALGLTACGGKDESKATDGCAIGISSCGEQKLAPIEDCPRVAASGNAELDAAYAKVRALHFYRYGDHPYCEATSHIMAYEGVVESGLSLRKLIISFKPAYEAACGRYPEFAWHTVAALPSASAEGGYLVLDPVYRCGINTLADYLEWYVATDCPDFSGTFAGCTFITEADWFASTPVDAAAMCVIIDIPAWYYDLFNCSSNLGEPWEAGRLARAYSYVRTDLNGTTDYASRPGASSNDYGCDF